MGPETRIRQIVFVGTGGSALGDYLRARREEVDPSAHALTSLGPRRVPGLRREEVADLAGVSLHYYIRLEQGRDRHPSPAVVDALARVLLLDEPGRAHLARLTGQTSASERDPTSEIPSPGLLTLIDSWTNQMCLLLNRYRDVLASNSVAPRINPNFVPGQNLMRDVFCGPEARLRYPDWDQVAKEGVGALWAAVGAEGNDETRDQLVAELSDCNPDFTRLWNRRDAREKPAGRQRFHVPATGTLTLQYEPLTVPYSGGQTLYVFFAQPGTHDADLLSQLAARDGHVAGGQ